MDINKLSPREREAVELLARGVAPQSEIARQMGVSPKTVRMQLASARAKLDCRDSVQLALRYVAEHGRPGDGG